MASAESETIEMVRLDLIEALNEGAVTLSEDGVILTHNNRFAEMVKVPGEQITQSSFYQFFPAQEHEFLAMTIQKARRMGTKEIFTLRAADGSNLPVELSVGSLKRGDETDFFIVIADVTMRKRQEHALWESEQRFRRLADEAKDYAIILLDRNGRVTHWNRGAERLKGYTEEEVLGASVTKFYIPEDVQQDKARLQLERAANDGRIEVEGWRVRKDGSRFWANIVITSLHDLAGELVGFSKLVRDMTERKRADDALRAAYALAERRARELTATFDAMLEPAAFYNADGVPVKVNPAMVSFLGQNPTGFSPEQYGVLLRQFNPCTPEGDPIPLSDLPYRRALRGEIVANAVIAMATPSEGRRIIEGNATCLKLDVQVAGALAVWRDITDRWHAEQLLVGQNRILEAIANRVALDDIFAGIIKVIEAQSSGMFCTIQMLAKDAQHLGHGVGPSLPQSFLRLLEGERIGPQAGSCGTSAYRKQLVCVSDIRTDPLWENYRALAAEYGFVACWSTPILSHEDKVLGTFAMYYREPRSPSAGEVKLIETANYITRVAIEHQRAEQALRESEERFRTAFISANLGVAITDLSGLFQDVNPAYTGITGYTKAELLERNILEITHPEDRPKATERIRQMVEQNGPGFVIQKRYLTKAGGVVWVQNSVSLLADSNGRSAHIIGLAEDITERKWAEESLHHAKRYAESLIQSANVVIIALDKDANIQTFNPVAEQLTGYTWAEMIGRNWFDTVVPSERYPWVRDEFMRLVTGGKPWDFENPILTKSGDERIISWRNSQIREDGNVLGTLSYGIDITERKKTEEALRRSEERFRTIAETIPEFIFTCRPDGWNDYCNGAFYKYTGLNVRLATGFGWLDLLHPDDHDRVKAQWMNAIRTGQTFEAEYRLRAANGEYRWFLSRKIPIRNVNDQIVQWQGITTNIDQQKRAEEILEKRVAQRTAKLQETVDELEQYSFSITHDLRAPLRAIEGFAHLLKQEAAGALSPAHQEYLQRIASSAERMENLIRDSLNYGKLLQAEVRLEPVNTSVLISEVIQSYPALQPASAEIALEGEFPRVLGNDARVAQCVSNILLNAVKFVAPATMPQVRIWAENRGEWVRIFFKDNGIGIPKEAQNSIFGMFQQLDKSHEGTGIGLAIVRKAAERMGGKVGVESEPGQGSCFWLDLKRAE